jgi:hypothetical protein
VSDNFFGDGLVFEDSLPLAWAPGPLPQGAELARLNAENQQLLGAVASLEQARLHEPLKDESPAVMQELQRLEFKLDILLRLTAEISMRHAALPAPRRLRLAARGLEWLDCAPGAASGTGVLHLYVNPALPQSLKLPCRVAGERLIAGEPSTQFEYHGVGEPVVELIDKFIFRHHRRSIAGAKNPGAM